MDEMAVTQGLQKRMISGSDKIYSKKGLIVDKEKHITLFERR
jgi:hypothetical protein